MQFSVTERDLCKTVDTWSTHCTDLGTKSIKLSIIKYSFAAWTKKPPKKPVLLYYCKKRFLKTNEGQVHCAKSCYCTIIRYKIALFRLVTTAVWQNLSTGTHRVIAGFVCSFSVGKQQIVIQNLNKRGTLHYSVHFGKELQQNFRLTKFRFSQQIHKSIANIFCQRYQH